MSVLVKGASLRAHIGWLRRENKLELVRARVPMTTQRLIDDPPLPSTWLDSRDVEPLLCALEAIDGRAGVLRMARDAMHEDSFMARLRPMLAGVVRLFGTSPATLFRHLHDLVKSSVQGMSFEYLAESERAGVMEVRYAVDGEVPGCTFVSCMAALESLLELCGVNGVVGEPQRVGPAAARFRITW
jgi:hypothetical protein